MSALEKIVMVGRGPPPPKVEGEEEEELGEKEAFSIRSEEDASDVPLGVQLLEYEQEMSITQIGNSKPYHYQ